MIHKTMQKAGERHYKWNCVGAHTSKHSNHYRSWRCGLSDNALRVFRWNQLKPDISTPHEDAEADQKSGNRGDSQLNTLIEATHTHTDTKQRLVVLQGTGPMGLFTLLMCDGFIINEGKHFPSANPMWFILCLYIYCRPRLAQLA